MKVQYSLKHAEGKLENPLLGTEATDGFYADVCPHGGTFTILVMGEISYWFEPTIDFPIENKKNSYKTEGDRRFASFPANSVITFTQD